jgi:hypothetical protein
MLKKHSEGCLMEKAVRNEEGNKQLFIGVRTAVSEGE